ncbi:MAG: malate:quinone oxidoreductase [Candidatus Lightella neohaematopini]|nr:malate:quinone oxidoreductase [Candidatus Lightella neohaematopini]
MSGLVDIVLIGSGIVSTSLAILIHLLEPKWVIHMYEKLPDVACESTNVWHNSGTGHAGYCELNYTPKLSNNDIDISTALRINKLFSISIKFWSFLAKKNILNYNNLIHVIPHISFVVGNHNINFLYKRFNKLVKHKSFNNMQYSNEFNELSKWIPLIMDGRNKLQKVAATKIDNGTDINFSGITKQIVNFLRKKNNFYLHLKHTVINIINKNYYWNICIKNNNFNHTYIIPTKYVFIGCGGATLLLLQKANIINKNKYAAFSIGSQFLLSKNHNIVDQHWAKVYSTTINNYIPMSIPHMDTRIVDGEKFLLFGPFAILNTKFLNYGSVFDWFKSIGINNMKLIFRAGVNNIHLIKYLLYQSLMLKSHKINLLKYYYPKVNPNDWSLIQAGKRVQIIKNNTNHSELVFGNEIVHSSNYSLTAVLGASPGASTSVSLALKLLKVMFKSYDFYQKNWKNKLKLIFSPK